MKTNTPNAYDTWFRSKVQEALDSNAPTIAHSDAVARFRAALTR